MKKSSRMLTFRGKNTLLKIIVLASNNNIVEVLRGKCANLSSTCTCLKMTNCEKLNKLLCKNSSNIKMRYQKCDFEKNVTRMSLRVMNVVSFFLP